MPLPLVVGPKDAAQLPAVAVPLGPGPQVGLPTDAEGMVVANRVAAKATMFRHLGGSQVEAGKR